MMIWKAVVGVPQCSHCKLALQALYYLRQFRLSVCHTPVWSCHLPNRNQKTHVLPRGSVPLRSDIKGTELPPANILIPLEMQLIVLQHCRWQYLYNETLQHTSRPLLSKLSERRQIKVFDLNFEKVRGGVEPWLMARWKARVDFY